MSPETGWWDKLLDDAFGESGDVGAAALIDAVAAIAIVNAQVLRTEFIG